MNTKVIPLDDNINNNLNGVVVSQQMNNLHSMLDDPNSQEFLAIVSTVHHERVGQPLNNGALRLPEPLHRVPAGGVRHIRGVLGCRHSDIISQRNVSNLITQNKNKKSTIITHFT